MIFSINNTNEIDRVPFFDVDETTQTGQNVFVGATKQTKQTKQKMKKLIQKEFDLLQTVFAAARTTWRAKAEQSSCKFYKQALNEMVEETYQLEVKFFKKQ